LLTWLCASRQPTNAALWHQASCPRLSHPHGITSLPPPPPLSPTLNCTSYTDSFCYEQQLKGMQLNQCCKKGVYVTDMCSADRCTEETRALCCFQKFHIPVLTFIFHPTFTCCGRATQICASPVFSILERFFGKGMFGTAFRLPIFTNYC
uniref:DB domain-containing protein n=1 Tax=Soboliphyme baturini TaxID=241478 RepID=A0A183IKJ2_9BILA